MRAGDYKFNPNTEEKYWKGMDETGNLESIKVGKMGSFCLFFKQKNHQNETHTVLVG